MKKMSLKQLIDLFVPPAPPTPGNPNTRTKPTKKNHIHKHKLSLGQERHKFYLATQPKKEVKNER